MPQATCDKSFTALGCGVNNPALLLRPDGRFLLYFKAKPGPDGHARIGVAVAERLGGPYAITNCYVLCRRDP